MNIAWGLIITSTLLLPNTFFIVEEFATTPTRRPQIEVLRAEGAHGPAHTMYALRHASPMPTICRLGVTIASTTLGLVAGPVIAKLVEGPLAALDTSASSAYPVAFLLVLVPVLFLHVAFVEIIPKNVSTANPAWVLLLLTPVLVAIGHLLRPITRTMDEFANRLVQLFSVEPKSEITATFAMEETASIVEVSAAQGTLSDDLGLLSGAPEFSEESTQSVMVPLDGLVTSESTTTPVQVERKVAVTGFPRFPTANEEGMVTGYLHLKGVLYTKAEEHDVPATPWRIHKMGSVNAEDEVEDALRYMQKTGTYCALVVDDVRRVLGVFFLEDVLRELASEVGDGLQRDDLAWERSEERWAFGGDVDRHLVSSFRVGPGSSCGTRGSMREGEGFVVRAHLSRG